MFFFGTKKERPQGQSQKLSGGSLVLLVVFFLAMGGLKLYQYYWPEAIISVGPAERVSVLVAKTPWHWHRGLGKRESLEEYDGMLFLFSSERRHGIVMRDMKFGIDIIWLRNGVVIDIAPFVPVEDAPEEELHVYYPREYADMVLETRAGWVKEQGVEIGDTLQVIEE